LVEVICDDLEEEEPNLTIREAAPQDLEPEQLTNPKVEIIYD